MIPYIDAWVARLLGMTIEPDLRVPVAIAAGMVVLGTLVFAVAMALLMIRRRRG